MKSDANEASEAFEVVDAAYRALERQVTQVLKSSAPDDPHTAGLLDAWSQVRHAKADGDLFEMEDALNVTGRVLCEILGRRH
jgi:hypothetical protein